MKLPLLNIAFMMTVAMLANAQPRDSIEGRHYQVIDTPVPTQTGPDRIEVREIFWYGCPECSTLEPLMTDWRDGTTGDLVFFRSPAVWNEIMATHARIFYTATALDVIDTIHRAAFTAIHQNGNPLRTQEQIQEFFTEHGVRAEQFRQAWGTAEVADAVTTARMHTADYGVEKVPSVIVNGQYRVTLNRDVPDHLELNIAVNMLIRQLRNLRRVD